LQREKKEWFSFAGAMLNQFGAMLNQFGFMLN
jgi:uncharacterized membrane protein YbjE (DUF340 family)